MSSRTASEHLITVASTGAATELASPATAPVDHAAVRAIPHQLDVIGAILMVAAALSLMLALAWGGTTIAYLRRHRPTWQFVCADAAVYSVLAFGAAWCVPTAIRGEAGSWLFILVTTEALLPLWLGPRALSLPLAGAPVIAFGNLRTTRRFSIVSSAAKTRV